MRPEITYENKIILCFLFILSLIYAFIAVSSHNHFLTFGWDLGYFDQLIWKISRGIYPFSSLSKVNLLAGHFAPILFLYAPLYWLWSDPRILLIAQAFIVVFAAWPLFLLARQKIRNSFFAIAIIFSYLFFIGTQWSILNEFHEATIVPLFLGIIFYWLETGRKKLFWFSIIGLFFVKEEMSLLVSSLGLTILLQFRRRILGISLFLFSFIFFFFLTTIFMPAISETGAYYHPHLSSIAKTPAEFTLKVITSPSFALKSLITPPDKIKTLISSFLSFGFLPLFAPLPILFPSIEQFLVRFLYTGPQYTFWQNTNHHTAPIAMLLSLASIYGVQKIIDKFRLKSSIILIVSSLILVFASVTQDIILKAPIHSIFKRQLYETSGWMNDAEEIIRLVPKDVKVASQNSLFPHLSQRREIYLLPEVNNAEYIAIDLHDGPNKYAPLTYKEMKDFVDDLLISKKYSIVKKKNEAMLLKKTNAKFCF